MSRKQYKAAVVSPPGDTLRELLQEKKPEYLECVMEFGKENDAKSLKVRMIKSISEALLDFVYNVIEHQHPYGMAGADILETITGTSKEFWLNREQHYRKWKASQ